MQSLSSVDPLSPIFLSGDCTVAAASILLPCVNSSPFFHRATFLIVPRVCVAQSTALSLTPCAGSATPWARNFSWSEAGQSGQQPRRVCTAPRGTQVSAVSTAQSW